MDNWKEKQREIREYSNLTKKWRIVKYEQGKNSNF